MASRNRASCTHLSSAATSVSESDSGNIFAGQWHHWLCKTFALPLSRPLRARRLRRSLSLLMEPIGNSNFLRLRFRIIIEELQTCLAAHAMLSKSFALWNWPDSCTKENIWRSNSYFCAKCYRDTVCSSLQTVPACLRVSCFHPFSHVSHSAVASSSGGLAPPKKGSLVATSVSDRPDFRFVCQVPAIFSLFWMHLFCVFFVVICFFDFWLFFRLFASCTRAGFILPEKDQFRKFQIHRTSMFLSFWVRKLLRFLPSVRGPQSWNLCSFVHFTCCCYDCLYELQRSPSSAH